ncbi:recombinase family protein [Roseomonas fluvialis]|nr:recombinase family protein [Roseomonas fluvialis]
MKTILYGRVSTAEQTSAHQRTQAEAAGFVFDHVLFDEGVSGVSTKLQDRPQGRRLFDLLWKGDVLVVRWIDRLGRNYADVTATLRILLARGVIVRTIINGMTFDGSTTDPMQMAVRDALIGFMAASAQAQAEATKEAQAAGIAHKKENDTTAYLGRKPTYTRAQIATVADLLAQDKAVASIAREAGLSRQLVYRIRDDRAGAEKALALWGL